MNDPDKLNDFGIRVEIQEDDPFINLIGKNWSTEYWFNDQFVRDEALKDMSSEHIYSRDGDKPTLIFTAIDKNLTNNNN
ncbi:MAG: hypothetical protein VYA80_08765 [Pseudomonadota bacterium]|nr:hypothetical protein [Pseudomonadota bacterium]